MIQKIRNYFAKKRKQKAIKHHLLMCEKFWQIAKATLQYYTDTTAGLDINPVIRANQELKEKIKTEQDLIYWHKKLVKSGIGFHYQRRTSLCNKCG
jgi:hypothetical protein